MATKPIKPKDYDRSKLATVMGANGRPRLVMITGPAGPEDFRGKNTTFYDGQRVGKYDPTKKYNNIVTAPSSWKAYYEWENAQAAGKKEEPTKDLEYNDIVKQVNPFLSTESSLLDLTLNTQTPYVIGEAGYGQEHQDREADYRQGQLAADNFVSNGWGSRRWGQLGWELGKGAAAVVGIVKTPFMPLVSSIGGAIVGGDLYDKFSTMFFGGDWNTTTAPLFNNLNNYLPIYITKDLQNWSNPGAILGGWQGFLFGKNPRGYVRALNKNVYGGVPIVTKNNSLGVEDLPPESRELTNLINFITKAPINDKVRQNQELVRQLLQDPKKFGMTYQQLADFNKSIFGKDASSAAHRKTTFQNLRNPTNVDKGSAFEKANKGELITGEEPDYMAWVEQNKNNYTEYPDFSYGADSKKDYYNNVKTYYNGLGLGSIFKINEDLSSNSVINLIRQMSSLTKKGLVRYVPYNGKMTKTNHYGNALNEEAVKTVNFNINRMMRENPDIDFGEFDPITAEGSILTLPELRWIKVSPQELKKNGGKLKLIKRKWN